MNQIIFDYLCVACNNDSVDGLTDDNTWEAAKFISENFSYQEIYNQIDNLLHDYLAKK